MTPRSLILFSGLASTLIAASAAERPITVSPVMAMSWEFLVPGPAVRGRPTLGVGFWQRASGAKPGVGSNLVATMEYQLPEAAPQRIRSASLQFSGRPAQCAGAEPVLIAVYAYAGNGKGEQADAQAGTQVAQMSADCSDQAAFSRPIDVTAIVRQLSVPSGVRHLGFNVRKANHRQGPGLFNLAAGKLTVVLADASPGMPMAAGPTRAATAGAAAATIGGVPLRSPQSDKPKRVQKGLDDLRSDR